MNKKEIQKYFDRRPSAQELYVVGNIVFINTDEAQAYADHTGSVVETKRRDDPEAPSNSPAGGEQAPEETDAKPVAKVKKNTPRKNARK